MKLGDTVVQNAKALCAMDGQYVTRGTRRFAGRFAKLRGRFADVSQVSHRALRTYHTYFTEFRGVSQTFRECHPSCHTRFAHAVSRTFRECHAGCHTRFAHVSRSYADISRVSRRLSHTFRARLTKLRERFASVTPAVTYISLTFREVTRTFRRRFAAFTQGITHDRKADMFGMATTCHVVAGDMKHAGGKAGVTHARP